MKKALSLFLLCTIICSCDELSGLISTPTGNAPLTSSEINAGIKEALIIGTKNAVSETSINGGFYNNPLIKIPFPPEAQKVAETARNFGLDKQVDQFVETMNHGAEQAASLAAPVFVNAVKQMSIADVYGIWRGESDAATKYLEKTTRDELATAFRPVIVEALEKVDLTKYWNPLINSYNQIPFMEKLNPNLEDYVLDKTLNGLFISLASEEARIRQDPQARVTDLLQRVFSSIE